MVLPRALPGGAAGRSFTWGRRGRKGGGGKAQFGHRWGKDPASAQSSPPASRGVDINTGAQPGPREREGGEGMFSYLHSPTPHRGGGAARRGGDSQASNSCISHDTAAVRASWEQCPARGNRSSTRDWWRWLGGKRSSPCWPAGRGGERLQPELQRGDALAARSATKQCPQEGTAAVPVSRGALPRPCVREAAQPPAWLLSPPHSGLQAVAPSQSLIPAYPPLTSFQDSAADAGDLRVVLCTAQRRAHAGGHGAATPVVKGM